MNRLRTLEADFEAKRASAKVILDAAAKDKRTLTEKEQDQLDGLSADLEALEGTLKAERRQLEYDRTLAPAVNWPDGQAGPLRRDDDAPAVALPALPSRTQAVISSMCKDQGAPQAERQDHFAAVVRAALGGDPFAPALSIAAGGSIGVGSDGGFAVRDDMARDIFMRAAEESVWMRIGARVETMASDTRRVVALDDDDESGDAEANLTAGWTAEGATASAQTLKLREVTLQARKLMVLAAATNELTDDAPAYIAALEDAIGRAIGKKFDRAVLSGLGGGQPLGILNAAATIEVSKTVNGDAGASNTFTWNHATGMWSRLAPGSHERAWWLIHPTVLPQALTMHAVIENVAGAENVGGFQPAAVFQAGGPTGYQLLGRPVVVTGRVKELSSKGDVILVDPTQVAIGIRSQIAIDRSPHVYFSSDQLAVRGKFRGDALPLWDEAATPPEGTTTLSPYVVLADR